MQYTSKDIVPGCPTLFRTAVGRHVSYKTNVTSNQKEPPLRIEYEGTKISKGRSERSAIDLRLERKAFASFCKPEANALPLRHPSMG